MLSIYDDDDVPGKLRAAVSIRLQPFYGSVPLAPDVIRAKWVMSHRYWLVGTRDEVCMGDLDALRQVINLERKVRTRRCNRCECNRVRSWL